MLIKAVAVAAITSGVFFAPTSFAADSNLPRYLVNGNFSYPNKSIFDGNERSYIGNNMAQWIYINPDNSTVFKSAQYGSNPQQTSHPLTSFSKQKFAWRSNQKPSNGFPAGIVELQLSNKENTNKAPQQYAEIVSEKTDYAIYQDIATAGGVTLKWRLDHAPLGGNYTEGNHMQVLIGEPGHETAQDATRITNNGSADKIGETSKTIATSYVGKEFAPWETYSGQYTVPGNGDKTIRFTFKALDISGYSNGNIVDNISFSYEVSLNYAKNDKDVAGSTTATTGLAGDYITVAQNHYTKPGHKFTGWSTEPNGNGETYQPGEKIKTDKPLTLYAQWSKVDTPLVPLTPAQPIVPTEPIESTKPIEPAQTTPSDQPTQRSGAKDKTLDEGKDSNYSNLANQKQNVPGVPNTSSGQPPIIAQAIITLGAAGLLSILVAAVSTKSKN